MTCGRVGRILGVGRYAEAGCCSTSRLPPRAPLACSPPGRARRRTTLPGRLLSTVDPGAVDRLAARLERGSVPISATNGKTTTTAMVAEILGGGCYTGSGGQLALGVASSTSSTRRELGLVEVDEAALPEVARRVRRRSSPSGTCSATSSTATASSSTVAGRWRTAARPGRDACCRQRRRSALGDRRGRARSGRPLPTESTTRRHARQAPHAGRLDRTARVRAPYVDGAAYVGHLGD